VLLADAAGGILHANPAARTLLGYGAEELQGRRLVELLPELPCLPTQPAASRETVCQRQDGRRLAVELLLRRTVIEGATCQFAFLREIDDRKRLEEQLREARRMETVGRLWPAFPTTSTTC